MKKRVSDSRKKKAIKTEKRLQVALYYSFQLLVDVLIILLFVKAFTISFNFAHDVFHDSAKDLKSREYMTVTIEPDSSTSTVASTLFESGVIKNKYVMMAKIKLGEVGPDIKPGNYKLSPSMRYSEIINIITGGVVTNDDIKEIPTVSTATDANGVHDNSAAGAGDGASEGDDYVPEDGGDSGDTGAEGGE